MLKLAPLSPGSGTHSNTAQSTKTYHGFRKSSSHKLKMSTFDFPTDEEKIYGLFDPQNLKHDEIMTSRISAFIDTISSSQKVLEPSLYTAIINLAKYTQKLENLVRFKNKEIERLEYLNRYLVIAQEKRDDMLKITLEENRKLKESSIKAEKLKFEKKIMSKFPTSTSIVIKQNNGLNQNKSSLHLHPINSNDEGNNPSVTRTNMNKMTKLSAKQTLNIFDDKKNQSILSLNENDTYIMYRENERLKFLENIIKDDEYFIHEVSNFDQALFITLWEAIQFIIADHKNLLFLVIKIKRLIKSAGVMTTSLVLTEAIEKIVEETCDCLDCERASVFMYDPAKHELWSKIAKGTEATIRVPANKGIVGHVFTKSETLNIPDAYHDDRFNKENDLKSGFKTNTILCVPIIDSTNQPIGVVQAINKKGAGGKFNKDDEGLLLILANLAGTILRASMSFNETIMFHNNLRLCLRIGIELSSCTGNAELINQAQKKLKIIMGGDKAKIILKNEEKNEIYTLDSEDEMEIYPLNCGIAGHVIETGEIESIANAYTHYLFNGQIDIETSMPILCQPIRHPETDKVIGAFEVVNIRGLSGLTINQKPKITPYDLETLEFFGKQLAQALINTQRWEKLNGKTSQEIRTIKRITIDSPKTQKNNENNLLIDKTFIRNKRTSKTEKISVSITSDNNEKKFFESFVATEKNEPSVE